MARKKAGGEVSSPDGLTPNSKLKTPNGKGGKETDRRGAGQDTRGRVCSPEDARIQAIAKQALAKKDSALVESAAKKIEACKSTTRKEDAALLKVAGDPDAAPASETFVSKWDDLAVQLGVDRRTLSLFRQRHAKRIKDMGPALTRADGRHDVAAWRALGDELGELRGKGNNNPAIDYIDERQLRLRRENVALQREELKLAKEREQLMPAAHFQAAVTEMVSAFNVALNQLPGRVTSKLVLRAQAGLLALFKVTLTGKQFEKLEVILEANPIEYADIQEILQNEIELTRRTLAAAEFIREEPGVE